MVSLLVGGALATGGLFERLWTYNRENFMWDKQNKQNSVFQVQNIALTRYGLFREDIRDLAGLTTNRMGSYLIVNTLKLGFIVQVYFNYDRTQEGSVAKRAMLFELWELLFSVCFLTAFLFLLTSVWFSMHATVVATSFMTKMLVQTVRIPMPSAQAIHTAVPAAREYEGELRTAFRVPTLHHRKKSGNSPSPSQPCSPPASLHGGSEICSLPGAEPPRPPSISESLQEPILRRGNSIKAAACAAATVSALHGGAVAAAASAAVAAVSGTRQEASASVASQDEGDDVVPEMQAVEEFSGVLPHLKLYRELMRNWQPYDLYSKICMSIGTSAMLSGLAYFLLYYSRKKTSIQGAMELPHGGGWFGFFFMSVLAWWSISLDLVLTRREHIFLAAVALSGPLTWSFGIVVGEKAARFVLPMAVICQCSWVWLLLAVSIGKPPRRWRALRFLDVLPEKSTSSSLSVNDPIARRATLRLLQYMRAILRQCSIASDVLALSASQVAEVSREFERLRDAAAAANVFDTEPNPADEDWDVGFWLVVGDEQPQPKWLGPSGASANRGCVDEVATLAELLDASRRSADLLRERARNATAWNEEDRLSLASYGGRAWNSVWDFEAPFHSCSGKCGGNIGKGASIFFRGASLFVASAWLVASIVAAETCSCSSITRPPAMAIISYVERAFENLHESSDARVLDRRLFEMPRAWFVPESFSCDADGSRFVVVDSVRAFARMNGSQWLGPLGACSNEDARAAVFDANGKVIVIDARGSGIIRACNASRQASSAPPLDALAVDPLPRGDYLRGLLVRDRQLLAVEASDNADEIVVAGAIRPPPSALGPRHWSAVAMRAGRGLALSQDGEVFELDASTGTWSGPWYLGSSLDVVAGNVGASRPESRAAWRGLCALPDGTSWSTLKVGEDGRTESLVFGPPAQTLSPVRAELQILGSFMQVRE